MMAGNRARKRAAETGAVRQDDSLPLITDETVLVTPELAQEMLKKNERNRPIGWKKVEEYSDLMRAGKWRLHSQGIVIDAKGNILTGQKRLWAVVYADVPVYMRISRGSPTDVAHLLDRGTTQTARDLAARESGRKYSPAESSIARAVLAGDGNVQPSKDQLSDTMVLVDKNLSMVIRMNRGAKKTRGLLMIMAAVCSCAPTAEDAETISNKATEMVQELEMSLSPHKPSECWGKGAAFGLAMEKAKQIVVIEMAKVFEKSRN